jgi:hypothetical protein
VERPVLSSSPESLLLRLAFLFARLRDRGDELGFTPRLDGTLRGLAGGVEFPVAAGIVVRGIEDRMVEKRIAHRDGKPIAGRGARCPAHEADESGKNPPPLPRRQRPIRPHTHTSSGRPRGLAATTSFGPPRALRRTGRRALLARLPGRGRRD